MKKFYLSICLVAIVLLSGCNKEEFMQNDELEKGTITTIIASDENQGLTKVSMEYKKSETNYIEIKWKENDKIALYPVNSSTGKIDYAHPVLFTLTEGAETSTAVFHADEDGLVSGTKYFPVHTGSDAISNISFHSNTFKFSLPEIQEQSVAGNISHIANNEFFTGDIFAAEEGTNPNITFKHNLSMLKFNITGTNGELQSVSLLAPGNYFLSGSTLKGGETDFAYVSKMNTRSYKVNLTASSTLSSSPSEVWMLCWWNPDVSLENNWVSDGKYTVTIATSEGVYVLNNALNASKVLQAGHNYVVNIDLADATPVNFADPNGTFVLNEGNMTTENGSVVYITGDGVVIDFAYRLVNGSQLGNVTQDMFFANNKIYFINQNGERDGGDGTLVVANASTLKKIKAYKGAAGKGEVLSSLNWPSHIAIVGNDAYIRDNNGVYRFNMSTNELSFIAGTEKAIKNRMAVVGDKVFVAVATNPNKIIVLQNGAVVNDNIPITNTTALLKADNLHVWVASNATTKKIYKINASDYSMEENTISVGGLGAGWGASPSMSAKGDALYFNNNGATFYKHAFNRSGTGTTVELGSATSSTTMGYNMPAIHPISGQIYYLTIKGYAWNFLTNDITVWNTSPSFSLAADYKDFTRFPAGVYFSANY